MITVAAARAQTSAARVRRFVVRAHSAANRVELIPLLLITLLLAALYWPAWPLVPSSGLDQSWIAGVTWAHQLGLDWGTDVIFTYGPMTFLDFPLASSRAGIALSSLAWIAYVAVLTGCVFAMIEARHADWSRAQRFAVTIGAGALLLVVPSASGLLNLHPLVPIALALVALAVVTRITSLAWLVGVACGLLLVHKVSDAALVGAVSLVSIAATLGVRGLVRLAIATGASFIVAWVASGQPLPNLVIYLVNEAQVVLGFAKAMSTEQPGYLWHYPLAIVLGVGALYCVNRVAASHTRLARFGFMAGIALGLWIAGREAFTRHDGHYAYFFAIVLVLCVILAILAADRRTVWTAVSVGVAAYLMVATFRIPILAPLDRQASLGAATQAFDAVSSHEAAQQILASAKQQLIEQYAITPELAAKLRSNASLVDPWDISAMFAVDAIWRPLPVLQGYQGYTSDLDAISAQSLANTPRQVLRSVPYQAIDGRNPYWEMPSYQLLLYCSYDVTLVTPQWQLLAPGAQRCGAPEPQTSITAAAGEVISVPVREGSITVVTITPASSLFEEAIGLLTKPVEISVAYGPGRWRFASSPAAVGLMLNAPVPHLAFADLPTVPFSTIQVTHAAQLDFAFVTVHP